MVKWNKEEIEPYFIQWNFPAHNIRYSQIIYCEEIIEAKEKKIVCLCYQERTFWLFTMKKNHFFLNRTERENYQIIYNHYNSSSYHKYFSTKINDCYCQSSSHEEEKKFMPQQQGEFVNKIFLKINTVKKFLLNYEKKY